MKYHVVSTSRAGHGAIFTNKKEAEAYQKAHPRSVCRVFEELPAGIPAMEKDPRDPETVQRGPSNGAIEVYTDGSALGNPGPGGWGAVIVLGPDEIQEYSQGYEHTTNNRMEMTAVIEALRTLADFKGNAVTIHSDSQYTINGITKGWARGWRKRGWKKSDGKPALNSDLWAVMLDLVDQFPKLRFEWVRGHAGNDLNERADDLANGAAQDGLDMKVDHGYLG